MSQKCSDMLKLQNYYDDSDKVLTYPYLVWFFYYSLETESLKSDQMQDSLKMTIHGPAVLFKLSTNANNKEKKIVSK